MVALERESFLVYLEPERKARHQGSRSLESDLDDDESVMMKLFLDSLLKFAIAKPDSLTLYTQEMADEMDELLAGVDVDEDE